MTDARPIKHTVKMTPQEAGLLLTLLNESLADEAFGRHLDPGELMDMMDGYYYLRMQLIDAANA